MYDDHGNLAIDEDRDEAQHERYVLWPMLYREEGGES